MVWFTYQYLHAEFTVTLMPLCIFDTCQSDAEAQLVTSASNSSMHIHTEQTAAPELNGVVNDSKCCLLSALCTYYVFQSSSSVHDGHTAMIAVTGMISPAPQAISRFPSSSA